MTDNMKKFTEALSADKELTAAYEQMSKELSQDSDGKQAILDFAGQHGLTLTEADLEAEEGREVSEAELEQVVGGSSCVCPVTGNGSGHGLSCFCFLGGQGDLSGDEGVNYYCTGAGRGYCICVAAGVGATDGTEAIYS